MPPAYKPMYLVAWGYFHVRASAHIIYPGGEMRLNTSGVRFWPSYDTPVTIYLAEQESLKLKLLELGFSSTEIDGAKKVIRNQNMLV